MLRLKIDLHTHTNYSDSASSVKKIVDAARAKGLDGIAITDHSTMDGYKQAAKLAPDLVIVPGIEIETQEGHVLVLGVHNPPPKDTSIEEVVEYVRKKGGLLLIPHPNIPFIGVREEVIERIRPDAIETHNAKIPFFSYFRWKNVKMAERLGLPQTGGSDAHSHETVGDMYTIIEAESRTVEAVLEAIRSGRVKPEGASSKLLEKVKMVTKILLREVRIIEHLVS